MKTNVSKFVVGRPMVIREHWAPEAPGSADKIRSGQRGSLAALVLLCGTWWATAQPARSRCPWPLFSSATCQWGAGSFPWETTGCRGGKSHAKMEKLSDFHFPQYPQVAVCLLSFRLFGFFWIWQCNFHTGSLFHCVSGKPLWLDLFHHIMISFYSQHLPGKLCHSSSSSLPCSFSAGPKMSLCAWSNAKPLAWWSEQKG